MDNFMNELYRVYPKYKTNKNDKDALRVIQSVTDFLLNLLNDCRAKSSEIFDFETLHFAFVVPTEWDQDIQQDMLRPIFIKSGLISKKDHPNRLLFITKLESILQLIRHPRFGIHDRIEKSRQYLICSFVQAEEYLSINMDAFELKDSLVNASIKFTLSSRVSKSEFMILDYKDLRKNIKILLFNKGFYSTDSIENTELSQIVVDHLLNQYLRKVVSDKKKKKKLNVFLFLNFCNL